MATSIKKRVEKMLQTNPEEVIEALLGTPFWVPSIKNMTGYSRLGDDDDGLLSVIFGPDNDGHVEVISESDPSPDCGGSSFGHRFRTYFGGGESLRTRTALILLAKAMEMDAQEHPQEGRRLRLKEKRDKRSS